jgi:hypothetical protein
VAEDDAPSPAPSARAASTNVWCLSDSTWPRTMRAMVSHCTSPSATNSMTGCAEKNTSSRMTRKM